MTNRIITQLIAAREAQELTRYAVSQRIGCAPARISEWEAGTHSPSLNNLKRWAAALGMEVQIKTPTCEGGG